jgi:predicted enzyme related to lactoylglutathione lyase
VHLDFAVEDLAAAVARAQAAGASVEEGITQKAWGSIALLADPFGNGFCLLQFAGRGYDEIAR